MIRLDFTQLHELASVETLIEPVRLAFLAGATTPQRIHYDIGNATLLLMPSWRAGDLLGIKIATVFPDNAAQGVPSVNAQYMLISAKTGQFLASLDGRALTLLRTAAVSALAANLLAPPEPETLLLVGTGALIPYLASGHAAVRRYTSIIVWGRDRTRAAATVAELARDGLPAEVAEDLEAAVSSAGVISCATMSEEPLVRGRWLKPNTHLDLVGGYRPTMREADDDCMRDAFVVTDTLTALEECGDLRIPIESGVLDASAVVPLDRLMRDGALQHPAERTVFKSVGVALADLAAAQWIVERSQA
ncbi:MAG TPA: ornithine cyclodeaminase family protein [Steroidobacteraceae bacterium]|jgi:ornithine cyclodeaminase/alanine dehydrogenase-like protein (mu-crystallin family)|nr:ornithine cyclodeaminase family protein [Steroidobacteraceae bacterium]